MLKKYKKDKSEIKETAVKEVQKGWWGGDENRVIGMWRE